MSRLFEVLGLTAAFPSSAPDWPTAKEVVITYCTAGGMRRFRSSPLHLENPVIDERMRVLLTTRLSVRADAGGPEEQHLLFLITEQNGDLTWLVRSPGRPKPKEETATRVTLSRVLH